MIHRHCSRFTVRDASENKGALKRPISVAGMGANYGRHSSAIHEGERRWPRRLFRWRPGIHRRRAMCLPPASGPSSSKRRPRPATPAPTARWPAASSSTRWATRPRTPRPRSSTSRAIPTTRSTAARSARAARRRSAIVHSANRLKYPMHRKPGSDKFERVSWDFAMDRIAKLMKEDRDKNFIAKNRDGVTVNRWLTHRLLRRLLAQQRGGLPHLQVRPRDRDTGVRRPSTNLTRSDGGQSWPHIRTRRDDELAGTTSRTPMSS